MKNVFPLIVVTALLVTLGFGQTPAPGASADPASVKGCLSGTDGNYILAEDGTTQTFKISSSTVDLKPHVGHDIGVTGAKTTATSSGVTDNSVAVTAVNMISDHCASATSSASPAAASTPAAAETVTSTTTTTPAVAETVTSTTTSTPAVVEPAPAVTASVPAKPEPAPVAAVTAPVVVDPVPTAAATSPVARTSAPEETKQLPNTATQLPLLGLLGLGLLGLGWLSARSRTT